MRRKVVILLIGLVLMPVFAPAGAKKHPQVPVDQRCADCHAQQFDEWNSGRHGIVLVECFVCHGAIGVDFQAKPDMVKCRGCHGERVSEVEKKFPPTVRSCYLCHTPHTVQLKFHGKRGE